MVARSSGRLPQTSRVPRRAANKRIRPRVIPPSVVRRLGHSVERRTPVPPVSPSLRGSLARYCRHVHQLCVSFVYSSSTAATTSVNHCAIIFLNELVKVQFTVSVHSFHAALGSAGFLSLSLVRTHVRALYGSVAEKVYRVAFQPLARKKIHILL